MTDPSYRPQTITLRRWIFPDADGSSVASVTSVGNASNVAVVNIDNGFGAGYVASLINRE